MPLLPSANGHEHYRSARYRVAAKRTPIQFVNVRMAHAMATGKSAKFVHGQVFQANGTLVFDHGGEQIFLFHFSLAVGFCILRVANVFSFSWRRRGDSFLAHAAIISELRGRLHVLAAQWARNDLTRTSTTILVQIDAIRDVYLSLHGIPLVANLLRTCFFLAEVASIALPTSTSPGPGRMKATSLSTRIASRIQHSPAKVSAPADTGSSSP